MTLQSFKLAASLCLVAATGVAFAAPQHTQKPTSGAVSTVQIPELESGKTILGQDFTYPTGAPLLKSKIVDVPPGQDIEWHKHAIPVFAYIMSGELVVDYGSKGTRRIKAGESYIEAINWCHHGQPVGNKPVKLLVLYLGQQNPDQIKPERCLKPE